MHGSDAGRAWVTWLVIALNFAAFGAAALQGADLASPDPRTMIRLGSNFGPLTISGEWWRLATSAFLHWGVAHLLLNMWALWSAGPLVERLLGPLRFALVYAFAALAGSLASILWNPAVNSAGASGAVFGVYGALLALVLRRHGRLAPHAIRTLGASTLVFLAFNLFNGVVNPGIDNAAHLGGLAAGFLLALPLVQTSADPGAHAGSWRLPIVAIAGAALLAAASLPVTMPGSPRAAEARYRADAFWFAGHEPDALQAVNDAAERVAKRQAGTGAMADALQRTSAFWMEADRRLSRHGVLADPALDAERRMLQAYVALRREGFALILRSLRHGSERDLRRGREANARAEALIRGGRT